MNRTSHLNNIVTPIFSFIYAPPLIWTFVFLCFSVLLSILFTEHLSVQCNPFIRIALCFLLTTALEIFDGQHTEGQFWLLHRWCCEIKVGIPLCVASDDVIENFEGGVVVIIPLSSVGTLFFLGFLFHFLLRHHCFVFAPDSGPWYITVGAVFFSWRSQYVRNKRRESSQPCPAGLCCATTNSI